MPLGDVVSQFCFQRDFYQNDSCSFSVYPTGRRMLRLISRTTRDRCYWFTSLCGPGIRYWKFLLPCSFSVPLRQRDLLLFHVVCLTVWALSCSGQLAALSVSIKQMIIRRLTVNTEEPMLSNIELLAIFISPAISLSVSQLIPTAVGQKMVTGL